MSKRKTTEEFIAEAIRVHGDKYDYSKVVYKGANSPVCIICARHGEFIQRPNDHIRGVGCRKCHFETQKKKIANVGINDIQYNIKENGVVEESYKKWASMIHRCYDKKEKTYMDCSVCNDWLLYSNFKKWHDTHYVVNWELDKDILFKGNKIYSPQTCCFVPQEINKTFTKTNSKRGELPIGVTISTNKYKKYRSQITIDDKRVNLGCFYDVNEAFYKYKEYKEKHIKNLADKWKDQLEPRVYEALYNYKVEITD